MGNDNNKNNKYVVGAVSAFTHIGVTIAACLIIGVYIGKLLDRTFGTAPWMQMVFSLLGVAAAIKTILEERGEKLVEDDEKPLDKSPSTKNDMNNGEGDE